MCSPRVLVVEVKLCIRRHLACCLDILCFNGSYTRQTYLLMRAHKIECRYKSGQICSSVYRKAAEEDNTICKGVTFCSIASMPQTVGRNLTLIQKFSNDSTFRKLTYC